MSIEIIPVFVTIFDVSNAYVENKVFIPRKCSKTALDRGSWAKVLSQAAKQTKADLLVTGCYPYGGHLRTHGYGIICAVPIPVLNV